MADRKICEWLVSLSDGRTFSKNKLIAEGKPAFKTVKDIVDRGDASITGIRLQRDGITHNAPSASPKQPLRSDFPFVLDHRMRGGSDGKIGEFNLASYQAFVKDFTGAIKLWVDERTGDTYLQLVANEQPKVKVNIEPGVSVLEIPATKEAENGK